MHEDTGHSGDNGRECMQTQDTYDDKVRHECKHRTLRRIIVGHECKHRTLRRIIVGYAMKTQGTQEDNSWALMETHDT
jgi:hypothetical protein